MSTVESLPQQRHTREKHLVLGISFPKFTNAPVHCNLSETACIVNAQIGAGLESL
jgi:hypothetical protein